MAFSLIPKEEKFFDMFEVQAKRITETAKIFKQLLGNWDPESPLIQKIRDLEHEADSTTHEIIDKLNRTFITPFDREDIHRLASKMDEVIDLMQGTASRMHRYHLKSTSEELVHLAEIVLRSVETMEKAVFGLRDIQRPKRILEYCIEINSYENQGDQLLDLAMEKLFANQKDPIEVIKWKEIYEMVETATDMCEDVANTIESIVVKHG
jgi:predicted phosphate transport protein (TIGR00153 family)